MEGRRSDGCSAPTLRASVTARRAGALTVEARHECGAPCQYIGHRATQHEPDGGASRPSAKDVRVDAASLLCREVVAGQRCDRRTGGGDHGPEGQAREQQVHVTTGECGAQQGDTPEDEADCQQRDATDAVDEQAHRHDVRRSHYQHNRAQQTDLRVTDPQRVLELGGHRPDSRRIRAAKSKDGAKHHDHASARGAADQPHHVPAKPAADPECDAKGHSSDSLA